ncbi:DUF3291 domain-containing protein [Pseudaminobacter sp. 19-2017]|uniref:DUF3291 domain-containing protein n=2 Tax=Pseudaminobacter soli (ex Zhang et al. 2022) TaxID=2831468 RepID=A0A942I391_9HYPH|nr:DUF3291 domain-containing protein [Pseudaminobacter soli]MBS3649579.1 DUF3291 domain-containing protein [Pseudaminobacter soli]
MTKKRVALYTFGIFRAPATDAANQGFHDRNDRNLLAVERSEGFIARSGYDEEPGPESWGKQVFPRFYVERGDGWSPSTLSLWKNLESPMAFAYAGIHAEALRHGREWFTKPVWPPYVLWWVGSDHVPTWVEAVARHEHLHDLNPSPSAFDFKTPFDEHGRPTTVDRDAVKGNIRLNEERQRQAT